MAITLGDAVVWLRSDDSKLESGLRSAESKTKSWVGGLGGMLQTGMGFAIGGAINAGINAVVGSLGSLKAGMIDGNAQFEQYNTQFGVLLGSAEAAQERMAALAEFGQKTPFELPQVVEADKILQGFGLHAAETTQKFGFSGEQIRTIAGDVASGTGSSFQEMALLIGKFSSGATGEAISRMQELGITNRDELSKMGLEFSKSGQLLSPLPESMEVILGLMKKKYGGLMDAQSKTFSGMMSNLSDWASGTLRTIGQPIFEVLKDKLQVVLEFLGSPAVQTAVATFAQMLATGIGQAMDIVTKFTDTFGELGRVFFGFNADMYDTNDAIREFLAALGLSGPTIDMIDGYLRSLEGQLSTLRTAFNEGSWSGLGTAFWAWITGPDGVLVSIAEMLGSVVAAIANYLVESWPTISATLSGWATAFWDWVTGADGTAAKTTSTLDTLINGITTFLNDNWPIISAALQSWSNKFWGWLLGENGQPGAIARTGEALGKLLSEIEAWSKQPDTTIRLQTLGGELGGMMADGIKAFIETSGKIAEVLAALGIALIAAIPTVLSIYVNVGGAIGAGVLSGIVEYFTGEKPSQETSEALNTMWTNALKTMVGVFFPPALFTFAADSFGKMKEEFEKLDMGSIGTAIVEGIANGISNGASLIADAAMDAARAAYDAAKGFLGISSPSKLMEQGIGANISAGIGKGITGGMGGIQSALNNALALPELPNFSFAQAGGGSPMTVNFQPGAIVVNGGLSNQDTGTAVKEGVLDALRSKGLR